MVTVQLWPGSSTVPDGGRDLAEVGELVDDLAAGDLAVAADAGRAREAEPEFLEPLIAVIGQRQAVVRLDAERARMPDGLEDEAPLPTVRPSVDPPARRNRDALDDRVAAHEMHDVEEIGHHADVVGDHPHAVADARGVGRRRPSR